MFQQSQITETSRSGKTIKYLNLYLKIILNLSLDTIYASLMRSLRYATDMRLFEAGTRNPIFILTSRQICDTTHGTPDTICVPRTTESSPTMTKSSRLLA